MSYQAGKKLLVLTQSAVKRAAVEKWWPDVSNITFIKALEDATRPEQPIAYSESELATLGRMRIDNARIHHSDIMEGYDAVLSIENIAWAKAVHSTSYIDYVDICCVAYYDVATNLIIFGRSKSFPIPAEVALEFVRTRQSAGDTLTFGKVVSKLAATMRVTVPHDDWYAFASKTYRVTNGLPTDGCRTDQILNALNQISTSMTSLKYHQETMLKYTSVYKDHPKPGVNFLAVMSMFESPDATKALLSALQYSELRRPYYVISAESRGFAIGSLLAKEYNAGHLFATKQKKVPTPHLVEHYTKEYGTDSIYLQVKDLRGVTVKLVDDVLATGGTVEAMARLAARCGARDIQFAAITTVRPLLQQALQRLRNVEVTVYKDTGAGAPYPPADVDLNATEFNPDTMEKITVCVACHFAF